MKYPVERISENESTISVSCGTVFSYHAHIHTYYEIILYEPFGGSVTINEESFNVDSYTCVIIAPSDLHKIDIEGYTEAKFIKLKVAEEVFESERQYSSFVLNGFEKNDFIVSLFNELLKSEYVERYVFYLVNAVALQIAVRGKSFAGTEKGEKYRLVTEAARILHEEFILPISQNDIAKRISVSPQYLSKIFKQVFGVGFSDYLNDIRLRNAAKKLIESDKTVTQICFECGCGNLSHFLRRFKEKYGVTPGEYRKEQQKMK